MVFITALSSVELRDQTIIKREEVPPVFQKNEHPNKIRGRHIQMPPAAVAAVVRKSSMRKLPTR